MADDPVIMPEISARVLRSTFNKRKQPTIENINLITANKAAHK